MITSDRPFLAAYVHIPFCARVCPYCDFAVVAGRDELAERYVAALEAEILMEPDAGPLDAIFVGGGTPSRLAASQLGAIIDAMRNRFGIATGAEVTLEANPEDVAPSFAAAVADVGFTRVSLGVQSLDDEVLAALGRTHDAAAAEAAVKAARDCLASVSVDLIFGSPAETVDSWAASVGAAVELEPDHISTYALTVERGTELSRRVAAGEPGPDQDDQADKYGIARSALTEAGYLHYEVSNYARPGHECRYNLNTWSQGDYLAFGLGAHGHRSGVRRRNVRRLDAYLEIVEAGSRPEAGRETVDGWAAELERVFLGLRRRTGVHAPAIAGLLDDDFEWAGLAAAGKVRVEDDRIVVLDPLFADAAARVVLDLPPPDGQA